ncbi:MAG TPA: hypothetical protein VNP98_09050 [Chthoniobacterales bacterium]|nr:hypothetical protein [Chthoniobacterales bacterium]
MLKKTLGYFTLPLLVLVGVSWQNSDAQPPAKSTEGQTVTRSRLVVVNGNVTLDLDLNRLKGMTVAQESNRESVRFEVGPNSFFTILAFNDALRGPQPGSMGLLGGDPASLPEPLRASSNQLIIEKLPSDSHFDLVLRDGKTGFVFFNIEGHLYKYDAAARSLSITGGRLLISEEFANKLERPADASAVAGEISVAATVHPIEISTLVNGAVKSAVLPPRKGGTPNTPAGSVPGPDIVVGDMNGLQQFGSSGTQVGLATGATSCNNGNVPFHFYLLPNPDHSVVSQNFYRMSGGASNSDRFEQLGYAWNKHTFGAAQENACGFGCTEFPDQSELGVGCSDPYAASQNAEQDDTPFGALGSRAWINPFTGFFPVSPRPENHSGHVHTGTSHRIAVERNDLNPAMNPGATYYLEVQYDSPHEYAWCQTHPGECNMYNNASYRRYNVSGTTSFTFAAVGAAVRMKPATHAWTGATSATIEPEPGVDGRAFVVYKVTNPSAGVWHYEYAIQNQNLDRSIRSFSVPLGNGITVSNVGFRAPPNHPGFPNDGTVGNAGFSNAAWTSNETPDALSWNTETFAQNPNANAIRFGTLYNFRFDSNRPPQAVNATIGFLKTGTPITVGILGPSPDGGASPTPSPTPPATPTPTPASPTPTPSATATPIPSERPRIDISVFKADSPDPVQVGQNLTYTITVHNHGGGGPPGPVENVTLTDALPASVNLVSVTASQGTCSGTSTIDCFLGTLPPFNVATVTLVVTPTVAGPLSNTAFAPHAQDEDTSDNSATASTTVLPAGTPTATPTPTTPTPTPTSTPTSTPTATPTSPTPTPAAQPINLSTRMRVLTGDNVGIGGFIITGNAPKHVLIRAIGPSLTDLGVPGALPDPVLELRGPTGFATVINNDWRDDPVQEALIEATGIPPTNDLESAIDATLSPGAYTAVVRGNNNTTGVALIEVYDLGQAAASKLANISTRAFVGTGNDIVIAGFILGSGSGNDRVVVRGLGPSLSDFSVPDVLTNPTLELRDSNGALLFANNDWQDDPIQASEINAAGLAPTNALESGIAATLPPGLYTTLLAGLNNGTGNGVVEVYDRGSP